MSFRAERLVISPAGGESFLDVFRSFVTHPARGSCIALGLFDGLHLGHMAVIDTMLDKARQSALTPVVFTFTGAPTAKGGRLLSGPMMESLLAQRGVRRMICPDFEEFCELTPHNFVSEVLHGRLGVAQVVCGYDFRFGKGAAGDLDTLHDLCSQFGIAVQVVQAVMIDGAPVASRSVRALVASGDIPKASLLLGRPFAIDFEVTKGRGLGRTIGFPTINQQFPADFALPRFGAYATTTLLEGRSYRSITGVGLKPTVGGSQPMAETFIQGFEGQLYAQRVPVEFHKFLRPEKKFESIDALREALECDMINGEVN